LATGKWIRLSARKERGYPDCHRKASGFIRQYVAKKQSFDDWNEDAVKSFQIKRNRRPGTGFDGEAPVEKF
jgi:hypothetical protein